MSSQVSTVADGLWSGGGSPYRTNSKKFGMWLFIISDSLTFSAMLFAYTYSRVSNPDWPTPFHFSPMSSRERRIIHLSLRNEPQVRSESTGAGPIRQVVVIPSTMTTVPEPIRPPRPRDEGDRPRFGDNFGAAFFGALGALRIE